MILDAQRETIENRITALGYSFVPNEGWVDADGHSAIIGWSDRHQMWRGAHTRPEPQPA